MVSPKALTTRPKKALPTGTPALFFVLVTFVPSVMPVSFPKRIQPISIFTDVLDHTLDTVFKYNDLSVHGVINAIDNGDTITNPDHRTCFVDLPAWAS